MKKIFKIHPIYYLTAIITIITGNFKDFTLITLIIIIHELGHISAAIYYKWNIEKIIILPFGGITIFNEYLNRPIKEELIIALAGPIYQIIFYYLVSFLNLKTSLFSSYHYTLLLFNLLPLIPLDGSKIFGLLLEKYLPYKLSNLLIIIISFLLLFTLSIVLIINRNLLMIIILFFILIKLITQTKQYKYIFNKFLFERYLYNFNFKKRKKINDLKINKMMRDKIHIFYYNNIYKTEKEVLNNKFDKNR